ncbi:NHL repeat-containing protein [bacterium]|nr:NHL repeat-containing protein [bacterium]
MAPSTELTDEFFGLLHDLAEERLTPDAKSRLEELILQSQEFRRDYLIFMQWHSIAERYGVSSERRPMEAADDESIGSYSSTRTTHAQRAVPDLPPPSDRQRVNTIPLSIYVRTALFVCALMVGIGITTWRLLLLEGSSPRAKSSSPTERDNTPERKVATLIEGADCEWANDESLSSSDRRLSLGWLKLVSGLAKIKFDSGNTILLEGPAELALDSPDSVTLRSGRLVSKSDSNDSDFTIFTSNTEVVDRNTECGILADENGSTEVHVFNGVAKVRQRGILHGAVPEKLLHAGEATRFETKPYDRAVDRPTRLDGPVGITFGPDGNLFVASRFTDSILRYDGQSGSLMNVFVPPRSGDLNSPFFLVFGPDGQLYVSSPGNHSVLRFDGVTGAYQETFIPPRRGDLAEPMGLAFGRDGSLFVASVGKQTVFRFESGTGRPLGNFIERRSGGLDGPTGIAFDAAGDLWVVDRNSNAIFRYDGTSGEFREKRTFEGRLQFPFGITSSPEGKMFVASLANHRLIGFDPMLPEGESLFMDVEGPSWPHALTFGPDGKLYVSSDSTNAVMRFDGKSGKFLNAFVVSWQDVKVDQKSFVREMPDRWILNTGLSRSNEVLRAGTHSPRWSIAKSPDSRFITPGPAVITDAINGWTANSERSSWISIAPLREDFRTAAGDYIFYVGFEVNPQDRNHYALIGTLWAHSAIKEIQLNGKVIDPATVTKGSTGGTEFQIKKDFIPGINFLQVVVANENEGPVAFRGEVELNRLLPHSEQ